ncbi:hypothetical protein D1B31_05865 [Neobacillus notoginsengisoli]|uniref:Uncharacterized protein n=1 Tax=Neobacillus notoginsengisoli TaxID=1578198 RepID=A0A417YXD7_9BACI|nr:hypothetical protein [Neobacillus notoginsengisoli]RHW42160.1 hypothetical protein D1B31_05865 [Neobacillus notoginsengisoli]
MTTDTKFPFYDHVLGLLHPYLPMIVNDMSSQIMELDLEAEDDWEVYDDIGETVYETSTDEEYSEEDYLANDEADFLNISISFERGFFPDRDGNNRLDSEEYDFEVIIKPFFTTKPYILLGLHNNHTKRFFAEVREFDDFQPIDIMERFSMLIQALFKDEPLYNKVFMMTSMAQLAIRELIVFDEPTYINGRDGNIQYVSSPYFELDNPPFHEFLIKQRHTK